MLTYVRRTGTILAMDIKVDDANGYLSEVGKAMSKWFYERNVLLRPLGNIVYLMPPYSIEIDTLKELHSMIGDALEDIAGKNQG